jgi:uncharacterized membrane protein YeiH
MVMTPIQLIELMAVVTAAIYGILLAVRSGLDLTGMFAVSFAAAFGGGTLRDLCLNRSPLFWLEASHYPVIVFFISLGAVAVPKLVLRMEKYLLYPDALGMGLFAVAGAAIALDSGTTFFLAALFGVMTGTFGGVVAEIVCNRIPATFRPGTPLNITCCFVGAWVFLGALSWGMPRTGAMALGVAVVTVMRIFSVKKNWTLGRLNRFSKEVEE